MDNLIKALKSRSYTVKGLAEKFKLTQKGIREQLKDLKLRGYLIQCKNDKWTIGSEPAPLPSSVNKSFDYFSDKNNTFKFGFIGDTHLGSNYERLDVLESLYTLFEIEGVDRVFHQGNWIEGEARFNKHDIHTHGLDAQCRYFAKHYPKKQNIKTYAITGDDHEGWWAHSEGIDVGTRLENIMAEEGRYDWINTGYMEAFTNLINFNSGKRRQLLSMHPGGGSAYATSYKPQKIVESFSGGEKPSVLLIGHYHKISYNMIRGVHTIQTGCTQDQTPFMRKKGIDAHVGGGICTLSQDPKTGAIFRCVFDAVHFYNKGFTNGRWTYGNNVALPNRSVIP